MYWRAGIVIAIGRIKNKIGGINLSNFIYITLDTTPPSNPLIKISNGAISTTSRLVALTVGTGDSNTTGYQMKIWGDVDESHNNNIKKTEVLSLWIPYSTNPQIMLSDIDGTKNISIKIRDDVHNESSLASSSIKLDTKIPTVTVNSADVPKISKVAGKDTFSFTFNSDKNVTEYKVKLVNISNATHDTGAIIGTTNGSMSTSGNNLIEEGNITTVTVKALDLELAGATTDGQKIIKVFVKDEFGKWSV